MNNPTNETGVHLRQFDATIEKWILDLDVYPLALLCRQPRPGSWSLGQVAIHIIDDTRYFIGQMKAALADELHVGKDMLEDAKAIFRRNAFPDMLLQGPSTNVAIRQPQSKDELLQALKAIQAEVHTLTPTSDLSSARGKSQHPGFQFFTALEWLQFAEMHMRHHFRQKERIEAALSEPPDIGFGQDSPKK